MADNTVSQVTPSVKENESIYVEFIDENTPAVLSTEVALRFQKKHKHVLEEIRKIQSICPKSFYEPNFRPIEKETLLPHSGGIRKDPAYLLSRDAFSLLVMGFTGSAAIRWKLKYIEAFNALERAALGRIEQNAFHKALTMRQRMTPKRRAQMTRALRYRKMGLELREIGKLMECSHQMVFYLLKDAKLLGLEVA